VVDDLMRSLRRSIAAATGAAQSSRNAFEFAVELLSWRRQLSHVREVLNSQSADLRDTLMSAVWAVYREDPNALDATSRTGVVKNWTHLLIDATEKMEREQKWAQLYAQHADSDSSFAEASASEAGSRWKTA
jgi:hypothetical protein